MNPGSQTPKLYGPYKFIEGTDPPVTYASVVMEEIRQMMMEEVVSI